MKTRVMVGGALIGALTGLGAAYLLVRRSEETGEDLAITPTDGVRIGLTLLGLLRQVSLLGGGK